MPDVQIAVRVRRTIVQREHLREPPRFFSASRRLPRLSWRGAMRQERRRRRRLAGNTADQAVILNGQGEAVTSPGLSSASFS